MQESQERDAMFEELDQERQALDQKYQQIDESFGFSQPELTEQQWQERDAMFEELDQERIILEQEWSHVLNPSEESQLYLRSTIDKLDQERQALDAQFGFITS